MDGVNQEVMGRVYAVSAVVGILAGAFFGRVWLIILAAGLPRWQSNIRIAGWGVLALFVVAGIFVLMRIIRTPIHWSGRLPRPFWYLWFVVLIVVEVALIAIGNSFFHEKDYAEWQASWTLFIVGVHFFGFAFIFRIRAINWLAVSMSGISAFSVLLSIVIGAPQLRTFLPGLGGALSLWFFSGWALCKMYRGRWIDV